jgi:hypothetical protein
MDAAWRSDEETVDLGELSIDDPAIEEGPARQIERTRATLAYLLLALLAALMGVLLAMLWRGDLAPEEFGNIAAIVTTPVVGLLGAATGYYYGSARR